MELTEILEEIEVGFRNNDEKSKKLHGYVEMVREALEEPGALYENEAIKIGKFDSREGSIGDTFIQGSYGTHTAIKHSSYEVDADIGFIIDGANARVDIREKIYNRLVQKFPHFMVEKKKPCITIDFKNGYKIDVAIYSRYNEDILFHNAIGGIEKVTKAKPKELIQFFNEKYADENIKRSIVRLIKHFIKIASSNLEIDESNKIPSIATNLIVVDRKIKHYETIEDTLYYNIKDTIDYFIDYVRKNGKNGPSKEELCVGNTFYKVTNLMEVMNVLNNVKINLKNKQYSELVSKNIFSKIQDKHTTKINTAPIGTLGA